MSVILPVCDYLQQTVDPLIANCAVESLKFACKDLKATEAPQCSPEAWLSETCQVESWWRSIIGRGEINGGCSFQIQSTTSQSTGALDANANNPINPQQPRKKVKPNNATNVPKIDPSTIHLPCPHGGELVYYPREALLNFHDAQANIKQLSGSKSNLNIQHSYLAKYKGEMIKRGLVVSVRSDICFE
jgi:hypothetical protein